jgi:hypothetical protein
MAAKLLEMFPLMLVEHIVTDESCHMVLLVET